MGTKERIEHVHLLRGITIAVIVFRHSLAYFDSQSLEISFFAKVVDELSFNWTVFFVLISGYLFQHLAYKYEMCKYWFSKVKNVIIPYLVVSFVCFFLLYYPLIQSMPLYSADGDNLLFWSFRMLISGSHSAALWYIPMITVVFFLGPLLYLLSKRDLTLVAIVCLLLSVLTFKPEPHETLKNVLHYLPVYIIGMMLQQKREILGYHVKNYLLLITVFFIAILGMSFHKKFDLTLLNISEDYLMTLEKIVLFVLLFYILERINLPVWFNKLFSYLADISFPIYFIHMIIIHFLRVELTSLSWWPIVTNFESGLLSTFMNGLFTILVLLLCMGVIEIIKLLTGNKSRFLIGA